MAKIVDRVVVFTQENHTTDNYFTSLRAWGANVATGWPSQPNPPAHDQAHSRAAYAKWLHAQANGTASPAAHTQLDTDTVLPYYAWLAKTAAFLEEPLLRVRHELHPESSADHRRAEPDAA